MNKFKAQDIVCFIQDKRQYIVIRVYRANDGSFKYDIQSVNGKEFILAMPENVLEFWYEV